MSPSKSGASTESPSAMSPRADGFKMSFVDMRFVIPHNARVLYVKFQAP
jgi:hypothetical protein